MSSVERAIPRFPGPKLEWHFWVQTSNLGITDIGGGPLETANFDYWITAIDVYAVVSGGQNEEFWIGFQPSIQPIGLLQVFFGAQISPNTGLYFPWRGLLQWHSSESLDLRNVNGGWSVYVSGFLTSGQAAL